MLVEACFEVDALVVMLVRVCAWRVPLEQSWEPLRAGDAVIGDDC